MCITSGCCLQHFPKTMNIFEEHFGFIQTFGEACIYKKVSGSSVEFLILYVDDILLIGNDIEFLDCIKGYLKNSYSSILLCYQTNA